MIQKIRRFVTGHDADGKSIVLFDDNAPNANAVKNYPGLGLTEIWVTDETPVDNSGDADRSLRPLQLHPTPVGTIFRVVEFPPDATSSARDVAGLFTEMRARNTSDTSRHALMHQTQTIDYLVLISGELRMLLDKGDEVTLRPGDCIVQRGTNHAWANRSDKPALLAAVLIGARKIS